MSEHAVTSSIEPDILTLSERHGLDRSMSELAQPRQLQVRFEALLILSLIGCALGFLIWRGFGSRKGHRALVRRLRQQLPRELRQRLTISILPGAPTELPTACYRAGDREFGIQCENGLISETALAHLCAILDHHPVSA